MRKEWMVALLGAVMLGACGGDDDGGTVGVADLGVDGGGERDLGGNTDLGGADLGGERDLGGVDMGGRDLGGPDLGSDDLGAGDLGMDLGGDDLGGADMGIDMGAVPCDPDARPFGGGLGTEASPHLVCDVAQLDAIRTPGNEGLAYVLEDDLDLAELGAPWVPLPSFAGTLDGRGHVVFGFEATGRSRYALIDTLSGTVRDLSLADVDIAGSAELTTFAVETSSGARLENVLASGRIQVSGQSAAGIVLTVRDGVTVDGAAFVGDIVQTSSGANGFVGGIARAVLGGGVLRRVVVRGAITSGRSKLGGIVSDLTGTVEQCVSAVRMETGGGTGGIAGVVIGDASVRDCVVRGSFSSVSNTGGVHGLVFALGAPTFERIVSAVSFDGAGGDAIGRTVPGASFTDVFFDADATPGPSAIAAATALTNAELGSSTEARLAGLAAPTWVREDGRLPRLAFEESVFPDAIPCNPGRAPFGGGLGTRYFPYVVCTAAHLDALRDEDGAEATAILASDVDLTGVTFAPIPSWAGVLLGNGFAVRHWTHGTSTSDDVAFIATLTGLVRDLALEDVDLIGRARLSALVGEAQAGATMVNVRVTGELAASSSGLGGMVRSMRSGARLEDAFLDADLVATGGRFHGGVVSGLANGATIDGLVAMGSLTVTGGVDKVGGVASDLNGALRSFVVRMDVSSARGLRVGGLAATLGAGAEITDGFVAGALDLAGTPSLAAGLFGERFGAGDLPEVERVVFAGSFPSMSGRPLLGDESTAIAYTDVFWDTTTTGLTAPVPAGTAGRTTTELQTVATYDGWPSPPWTFTAGAYPSLDVEVALLAP